MTTNGGLARQGDDALRLKRIGSRETVEALQWSLECAFAGHVENSDPGQRWRRQDGEP